MTTPALSDARLAEIREEHELAAAAPLQHWAHPAVGELLAEVDRLRVAQATANPPDANIVGIVSRLEAYASGRVAAGPGSRELAFLAADALRGRITATCAGCPGMLDRINDASEHAIEALRDLNEARAEVDRLRTALATAEAERLALAKALEDAEGNGWLIAPCTACDVEDATSGDSYGREHTHAAFYAGHREAFAAMGRLVAAADAGEKERGDG